MKKALSMLLAAGMMLALVACGDTPSSAPAGSQGGGSSDAGSTGSTPNSTSTPAAGIPDGPIIIGGLAPLTGEVSQYGIASSNGSKLAVEEINAAGGILGHQVEFKLEDEKGDATEALTAYNKLMQEGIVAIVGDITTKPTLAVAAVAQDDGIPMITPTGTGAAITEVGDRIFRACFTDPYQGELMAHYASDKLGAKTAAILYDTTDDYSEGVADAFEAAAKELGIEITTREGYEQGASDFNAQLTKIKAGNPDVIMAPCYYEDASKIITQARGLGIESSILGPDGYDGVLNQVDESNYAALNNTYYCSQYALGDPGPELQKFIDDYTAAYGADSLNMFAVLGYEAMHLMAAAIEKAGSVDSDAIVAALQSLQYTGVSGVIDFKGGQDPAREAIMIEFKDGKEEVLGGYSF